MTAPNRPGIGGPNRERGICSLTHRGRTLRFRTNPNSIQWKYQLNTKVEDTYGGRVIQLLGTKLGDLTVTAECGWGGWPYMMKVARFMRDLMYDQRKGDPALFEYTTRGWKLKVFATSVPFQDQVGNVSKEFTMTFKIQEDVSGVMSQASLGVELARLRDGVGWRRSQYNSPPGSYASQEQGWLFNPMQNQIVRDIANAAGNPQALDPTGGLLGAGLGAIIPNF